MTFVLTAAAIGVAIVGIGALALVAFWDRRVTLPRLVAPFAAMAIAALAALVLARFIGLDLFGAVHLLYLLAVVAMPIVGITLLLVRLRWKVTIPVLVVGALLIVPAPIGAYATHVAPFRLQVHHREVRVPESRDGVDAVRVAVLSDLQTNKVGHHERATVRTILDSKPDLIVITGDIFQGSSADLMANGPALRDLVSTLRAPGGVYFVQGDCDDADRLAVVFPPERITRLQDTVTPIRVRDRTILLGGTELDYASPAADGVRASLQAQRNSGAITLLASHRPDTVLRVTRGEGPDLVLAGHTHGGQVAIPGFGPLMTLSDVPRAIAAGGLHSYQGTPIYVSPGVGMERSQAPQVRFGVPPAVGIIDLVG